MTSSTINGGTIKGANIYAGNIYSYSGYENGTIGLHGYFVVNNPSTGAEVSGSRFGFVQMNTGSEYDKDSVGLGMSIESGKISSVVKATNMNAGLSFLNNKSGGWITFSESGGNLA
jgi:hypothetical protein